MHIRSLMASSGILFTVPCWLSLVFTTSYLYVALGGGVISGKAQGLLSALCSKITPCGTWGTICGAGY